MGITNIRELYGRGQYLAEVDGKPAAITKNPKLGAYRRLLAAMQKGEPVTVLPLVILSADKKTISADGLQEALVQVEVKGAKDLVNIELKVEGLTETVALDGGKGVLGPIAASSPGPINISPADGAHGSSLQITATDPVPKEERSAKRDNGRLVVSDAAAIKS